MAWSLAMRAADMSVKGMISVWQALIRPHLEYAAEVVDGKWEEAEAIQRQAGRRILKVGVAVGNAAVIGELGLISMAGRRALLRLNYWEKVLAMPEGRLPGSSQGGSLGTVDGETAMVVYRTAPSDVQVKTAVAAQQVQQQRRRLSRELLRLAAPPRWAAYAFHHSDKAPPNTKF